jgi:hypothetical protein
MILARRLLVITLCLALMGSGVARGADADEYEVKAAYLYRFLPFVTWPEEARIAAGQPIVVGIVGEDPFGTRLEDALRGKDIEGHPIVLKHFRSFSDYQPSAVVFVARSEQKQYAMILSRLEGQPVLVVGEGEEFCRAGGSIGFLMVSNKVRFAIRQDAIRQAGLQVSSKLMALAVSCPPGSKR